MKELEDEVSMAFDMQENTYTIIFSYSLSTPNNNKIFQPWHWRGDAITPPPYSFFRQKLNKQKKAASSAAESGMFVPHQFRISLEFRNLEWMGTSVPINLRWSATARPSSEWPHHQRHFDQFTVLPQPLNDGVAWNSQIGMRSPMFTTRMSSILDVCDLRSSFFLHTISQCVNVEMLLISVILIGSVWWSPDLNNWDWSWWS